MITISINPVALTLGPVEIRWYGILIALAVLTIVLWVVREVRKGANLSYDTVFTAALVGIPSAIIISQIISGAGLTAWGAILGAALGVWIYSRFTKLQFGYFADVTAPGIILAQAVGRVGCTLNGCCYGLPTSLPWGIVYTHPDSLAPLGIAIHPAQLYELTYNLIVFGVLLTLRGRLKPDGSLFLIYLSLYSLWRLGLDFLREGTPFLFGLHQAQVIAIIILAIAIPILVMKTRWVKAEG